MDPSFTSTSLPHTPSHHHSCLQHHASTADNASAAPFYEYSQIFNCNICMHLSHDPVITSCGHLFCWPCLYYQLFLLSASKECPVCKADVQDRIVPLYGCGVEISGYAMADSAAEKFCGIQIPCRPLAAGSIARHINGRSERRRAVHNYNEMLTQLSAYSGFCVWILRYVLASVPPESSGLLSRHGQSNVSLRVHRRRFNNEKEFVLHWVFILMALIAIAIFLAC